MASTKIKPVYCYRCEENIVEEKEVITLHPGKIFSTHLCPKCKEESWELIRERMTSNDNPAIVIHGRKVIPQKETRAETAERMRKNNPMFNHEFVLKGKETRERNGKKFPRGKNHKAWRGQRDRAQTIRARLYRPWVREKMCQAEFKCEMCGAGNTQLEVHHIFPKFRDILSKHLGVKSLEDISAEEFEKISALVEEEHLNNSVQYIVVCKMCHGVIDDRRRL